MKDLDWWPCIRIKKTCVKIVVIMKFVSSCPGMDEYISERKKKLIKNQTELSPSILHAVFFSMEHCVLAFLHLRQPCA